jgi:hypothetical protein
MAPPSVPLGGVVTPGPPSRSGFVVAASLSGGMMFPASSTIVGRPLSSPGTVASSPSAPLLLPLPLPLLLPDELPLPAPPPSMGLTEPVEPPHRPR